ncbi:hypothetical protein SAMN06297251_1355 [Fulvimarina manganoxydans]|uniref:Uncharacterized protein n=1 Tax=Fulvimarina manganoxydans TaxID=937218 RepID=A0A1W2ETT6_9HYPH|nr:hypothetical protein [Fulvimarina manganoxydans]SMD13130.1 hypothetical protein SAMN06297251_1355 [Fulvimarina manganoxydans]
MLNEYGLPIESRNSQERKLCMARESYERNCAKRSVRPDWDGLPSDERHMWLMTIEALMSYSLDGDLENVA